MRVATRRCPEPGRSALDLLFHASADCIKLPDPDGRVLLLNDGGAAAMELDEPTQLAGQDWVAFWAEGPQREEARTALAQARAGQAGRCRGFLPTAKGTPKWWETVITPVREPDGTVGQVLAVSRGHVVLMIVDLDRFKEVNDTLGHDAGEAVLRAAAQRLSALAPPDATVARLGGDEFAVLLHDAADPEAVEALAVRLIRDLSRPLDHAAGPISWAASVGVAAFPDHDQAGGELLKNADLALYAAKRGGRSRMAVFEPGLKRATQARVTVLQEARHALDTDHRAVLPAQGGAGR